MPNYAAIKAELALPKYAGMADADIAAALEADLVTVYSAVPTAQWEAYLLSRGFMISIQSYTGTSAPGGAGALAVLAAKTVLLMISSNSVPSIDLADPVVLGEARAMLGAFVAEGTAGRLTSFAGTPFAQVDMDALLGMGTNSITRAQQLGLVDDVHVIENEIAAARFWPGVCPPTPEEIAAGVGA